MSGPEPRVGPTRHSTVNHAERAQSQPILKEAIKMKPYCCFVKSLRRAEELEGHSEQVILRLISDIVLRDVPQFVNN